MLETGEWVAGTSAGITMQGYMPTILAGRGGWDNRITLCFCTGESDSLSRVRLLSYRVLGYRHFTVMQQFLHPTVYRVVHHIHAG